MQMNDDSMLTLYGLLHGAAVHQPTCVAYTLVPDRMSPYFRQQLRWMRGTFVRTFGGSAMRVLASPMFWMPLLELIQLLLSVAVPVTLMMQPAARAHAGSLALTTLMVGAAVNWTIALGSLYCAAPTSRPGFTSSWWLRLRWRDCGDCSWSSRCTITRLRRSGGSGHGERAVKVSRWA